MDSDGGSINFLGKCHIRLSVDFIRSRLVPVDAANFLSHVCEFICNLEITVWVLDCIFVEPTADGRRTMDCARRVSWPGTYVVHISLRFSFSQICSFSVCSLSTDGDDGDNDQRPTDNYIENVSTLKNAWKWTDRPLKNVLKVITVLSHQHELKLKCI